MIEIDGALCVFDPTALGNAAGRQHFALAFLAVRRMMLRLEVLVSNEAGMSFAAVVRRVVADGATSLLGLQCVCNLLRHVRFLRRFTQGGCSGANR